MNDDRYRIGTLPVAAPELIHHDRQWYIAALNTGLDAIRITRLEWRAANHCTDRGPFNPWRRQRQFAP